MNNLLNLNHLNNNYFAVRHGESKANIAGIIISDPTKGTIDFGLTQNGKQQVHEHFINHTFISEKSIIISSDFVRTKETALQILATTGHQKINIDIRLRERYFGDYDHKSIDHYFDTWQDDKKNAHTPDKGVETTECVTDRMTAVVMDCETKYNGQHIYLVSHGDPLQILETGFLRLPSYTHRERKKIENAEIRHLYLSK